MEKGGTNEKKTPYMLVFWLKDFRCKFHKFYEQILEGEDKRQHPHEDVSQENWLIVCFWFESDDYKKLSEQNKLAQRKLKVNHYCGSKPFVRYREEQKDKDTQQELGRIGLYRGTHFSEKKGRWVAREAEEIYEAMNNLHSQPTPEDSTPMTEDQVVDTILGVRPGYVCGLGHGQDPMSTLPPSSLDPQIVEDPRSTQDAERRTEDADRRAQEAERRLEETERRREESEKRMDDLLEALQAQIQQLMLLHGGAHPLWLLLRP